jgi:hypothetical protein
LPSKKTASSGWSALAGCCRNCLCRSSVLCTMIRRPSVHRACSVSSVCIPRTRAVRCVGSAVCGSRRSCDHVARSTAAVTSNTGHMRSAMLGNVRGPCLARWDRKKVSIVEAASAFEDRRDRLAWELASSASAAAGAASVAASSPPVRTADGAACLGTRRGALGNALWVTVCPAASRSRVCLRVVRPVASPVVALSPRCCPAPELEGCWSGELLAALANTSGLTVGPGWRVPASADTLAPSCAIEGCTPGLPAGKMAAVSTLLPARAASGCVAVDASPVAAGWFACSSWFTSSSVSFSLILLRLPAHLRWRHS